MGPPILNPHPSPLPFCWISSSPPKNWVLCPFLITDHIWEKISITFKEMLSTNYHVACVFSYTINIYLKKLVETISFNTKHCLVRLSPRIIPPISPTFLPEMSPSFNIAFLFPPDVDCLRLPSKLFRKSCTVSSPLFCWGRGESFSLTFLEGIRKRLKGIKKLFLQILARGRWIYYISCAHICYGFFLENIEIIYFDWLL